MLLKLENIGKIYDSNDILTVGIRGINLAFDYNEFVTIEGESGSGKSTLLNVIGANDTYEEGELYFNGEPTSHYSESDWEKYREKNIATIFQDFNIIENLTVLENVELALLRLDDKKERRRRAKELIARVGLTEQMNRRGSKLSGGEKQRTVIARALAKDAPIILADEPTGNLDVKASKEVAALLKEVSRDKLVIVVTHNPEFFKQYATRRVRIFDGSVSEDKQIEPPAPYFGSEQSEQIAVSRFHNFKNTLHIGVLNYKSRPKFTTMMTFALFVCAIALFVVLSVVGSSLIQSTTVTLDNVGIDGKVIVSAAGEEITADELDEAAGATNASYLFPDRSLTEFTVSVPRQSGMLQAYEVTCLYAPFDYNLSSGNAVLVLPQSQSGDGEAIRSAFLNAGVGIANIETITTLSGDGVYLYLSYSDLIGTGTKISAVNSTMRLGETQWTVYSFESNAELADGTVNLINSTAYEAERYSAVFSVRSSRSYSVVSASEKREDVSGLIVQMSENDYAELFESDITGANQAVLYFSSDSVAKNALSSLPEGMIGMLSTSTVSRSLAETLKGEFRLDELQSDRAVLLIYFEGEYRVSGIVPGGEPAVYLNKADYVNFLGVYDYVGFDANGLFISADYLTSTFTAEICEETAGMNLGDTEARIEIARNSLYKMMDDTSQADLLVQQVNNRLGSSGVTSTAMPITDSKLFVQRLSITRDLTTADIRIYVNADTLENIFVYLKPNLDSLQGGDSNAQFYFEINTEGGEQLSSLNSRLRDRGIATVNIQRIFDANDAEIKEEAASGLTIFYIAVVLLFLIYFFIAKSAGVKNSREYGVFRAIGVNRGNLLFKETVSAFVSDILSYFLFFLIATILIGMRFIIMNEAVGVFIGFAAAFFAASALVLLGIALIPYLFVLWQTPARILAKYDI